MRHHGGGPRGDRPPSFASKHSVLYKLCVVGESGVGKTSVLRRYAKGDFEETKKSTIGIDFFWKEVVVDGLSVDVQLWDTAGQERFNSLSQTYFRGAAGLICVFDVTETRTLEALDHWIDSYYYALGKRSDDPDSPPPPLLLLANKIDIPAPSDEDKISRAKILEAASEKSRLHRWYMFQVSAKEGTVIDEAINAFIKIVHESVTALRERKVMSKELERAKNRALPPPSSRPLLVAQGTKGTSPEETERKRKEREERWARESEEEARRGHLSRTGALQAASSVSVPARSAPSTSPIIRLQDPTVEEARKRWGSDEAGGEGDRYRSYAERCCA